MARLTVLGIGNILMRDDGVGVRMMEAVRDAKDWPPDVEFVDGGVGGLNLLNLIEEATRLVVFDAADMNLPAGQFRVIHPDQIDSSDSAGRLSMHQISFLETLQLCERFSRRPPTTILAIQAAVVERGRELSPSLEAEFARILDAAMRLVEDEAMFAGPA